MAAEDVNFADLDYAGLRRVYLENVRMLTIEQCDLAIAALESMIDRPVESDKSGERFSVESLQQRIKRAERKKGILLLSCELPVSYLPPDDLH